MEQLSIFQLIENQKISKVWRGYGGVIFLELGELAKELMHSSKGDWFSEKGEFTFMIEGAWSLEKETQELLNTTDSSYTKIDETLPQLVGLELKSVEFDESTKVFHFHITKGFLLKTKNSKHQELVLFQKHTTLFSTGKEDGAR